MLTTLAQRRRTRYRRAAGGNGLRHPARVVVGGFALAVALGTALLSLPVATRSGQRADLLDALFTATSAVCVTGLVTVDTGGYWSHFGQIVILGLIQAGGLGIMTLATVVMVMVSGRLGLRGRMVAQAETKTLGQAGIRALLRKIVVFSLASEAVVAAALAVRFAVGYHDAAGAAAYHGVFHAVSAFNNAGFGLRSDNLVRYVADPWICLPVTLAVIVGGLGFPVVFELARSWHRPRQWSVLTRLTVIITAVLLVVGTIVFTATEAGNPRTLGNLDGPAKLLAGFFQSVVTRTAGFNTIDIGGLRPASLFASDVLMFVGGGSAGTAGGIKVTTFGLLAYVMWSEMRGENRVNVGIRRIPENNQRQALTVALTGIGAVTAATFLLLALSPYRLEQVLFEAVSAFGTVGLSTGITGHLPPAAQLVLVGLMFLGRTGPLTVASALALRQRGRRFELPEERTIVG